MMPKVAPPRSSRNPNAPPFLPRHTTTDRYLCCQRPAASAGLHGSWRRPCRQGRPSSGHRAPATASPFSLPHGATGGTDIGRIGPGPQLAPRTYDRNRRRAEVGWPAPSAGPLQPSCGSACPGPCAPATGAPDGCRSEWGGGLAGSSWPPQTPSRDAWSRSCWAWPLGGSPDRIREPPPAAPARRARPPPDRCGPDSSVGRFRTGSPACW